MEKFLGIFHDGSETLEPRLGGENPPLAPL